MHRPRDRYLIIETDYDPDELDAIVAAGKGRIVHRLGNLAIVRGLEEPSAFASTLPQGLGIAQELHDARRLLDRVRRGGEEILPALDLLTERARELEAPRRDEAKPWDELLDDGEARQ